MSDVTIGPDYDPDRDELRHTPDGTPITRELIDRLAEEAEAGYDLDQFTRLPSPHEPALLLDEPEQSNPRSQAS